MSYEFETLATETVPITHRNKTAKYVIRELTEPELKTVSPTNKDGTPDKSKSVEWNARLISTAATREDGTEITFEQAQKWPLALKVKLVKAIMDFNGLGKDAEDKAGEG